MNYKKISYYLIKILLLIRVLQIPLLNYKILYLFISNTNSKKKSNVNIKKQIIDDNIIINVITQKLSIETLSYIIYQKITNFLFFLDVDFNQLTEMSHINYVLNRKVVKFNYDIDLLNNKLYWYYFCKKYQIPHPTLYLYKENHKITKLKEIDKDKYYLYKPLNSCRGSSIDKIKGNDINSMLKKNNNFMIQDLLIDNNTKYKTRYFRITTFYTGELFMIYEMFNKKYIAGNEGSGRIKNDITDNYLINNVPSLKDNEKIKLDRFISKITNIHHQDLKHIFSIGWDVMFGQNNELHILEGNVDGHGHVLTKKNRKKYTNLYYNKAKKFIKDYHL